LVIEQGNAVGCDAELAVLFLAKLAIVLACDPGAVDPLLAKPDSSRTPTTSTGVGTAESANRSVKRDLSGADAEGDRLDGLAPGAAHQPLGVDVGVVLGLLLDERGGEIVKELDQVPGRHVHVGRCHGGSLLTKGLTIDESAGSRVLGSLPLYRTKRARFFLRL